MSTTPSTAEPVNKQLPEHLKCNKCSRPVFNSHQTPHGCRLCQLCYNELPISTTIPCPGNTEACRDEDEEIHICQNNCFPDIATRREIGRLKVFCTNRELGCQKELAWKDLETHLTNCEFVQVKCDQCNELVLKKRLAAHRRDECPQRKVQCELCKEAVVEREMKTKHYNLNSPSCCPRHKSSCPYCNSTEQMDRQRFLQHLPTCPQSPRECKYKHLGCTFMDKESELAKHYDSEVDLHVSLMDEVLRRLGSGGGQSATAPNVTPTAPPAAAAAIAAAHPSSSASTTYSSPKLNELYTKFNSMYEMFKKLQINVANWAFTCKEFDALANKQGGIHQFMAYLKQLEDKLNTPSVNRGVAVTASSSGLVVSPNLEMINQMQATVNDLQFRLVNLESTNYDGYLVWKVDRFSARRREARDKSVISIFSQPFFSHPYGYQFRVRLFLNGKGSGEGQYLSIYLVVIQHDYDDILQWPVTADVTFRLIGLQNRSDSVEQKAKLNSGSARPRNREDLEVNCGEEKFVKLEQLDGDKFVKNDCFFIEANVDVGGAASGTSRGATPKRRR